MKQYFFAQSILLIFLLASCATPRSIIKLKPQSEQTAWFYGEEFTGDSVFGIIAKVGFDEIDNASYLFDVEITNRSNMPFLVDPTSFYCVPLNDSLAPINGDTIYATDPEARIKELDKDLAQNAAREKNQLALTILSAGIDIATGVIVLTDDNPRNDYFRTDLLPAVIAQGQENRFEAMDLNQLRDTWKSTTLRKTTLESGYAIHGKLLIPIAHDAPYIQFNLPVDNEIIRINFIQTKTSSER